MISTKTDTRRSFVLCTFIFISSYNLFSILVIYHVVLMLYLSCFNKITVISYPISCNILILFLMYFDTCLYYRYTLRSCRHHFGFVCRSMPLFLKKKKCENGALRFCLYFLNFLFSNP